MVLLTHHPLAFRLQERALTNVLFLPKAKKKGTFLSLTTIAAELEKRVLVNIHKPVYHSRGALLTARYIKLLQRTTNGFSLWRCRSSTTFPTSCFFLRSFLPFVCRSSQWKNEELSLPGLVEDAAVDNAILPL